MCACANIKRHTQNFKTKRNTGAQFHGIFIINLYLGTISLEASGILFPESSRRTQVCWEPADHNRRHQISGASGYTYWSLQGSGKILFFNLRRLAQLSVDITLAFLWSVSYQKLNKPDGVIFWLKVTEQTNAWMLFLFKDGKRITELLHLICIFLWKGGSPKRNFSQVPFVLIVSNKIENKRKGRWLTT